MVSVASAQSYLAGVRNHHIDRGYDISIFNDERFKRIIKGAKHVIGTVPPHPWKEITKDILLTILPHLNRNTFDDLNIFTAFCTTFAAFLRCGEFTWDSWNPDSHLFHLSRHSVQFLDNYVTLHLPSSKTDPYCQGTLVPLAQSPDPACPVKALSLLFTCYPTRNPSDPLFSCMFSPFNQAWVINRLQSTLLAAGIDPTSFSGHSFR